MNVDLSGGYGLTTQTATRNPNVSLASKGLYSYICSYAGSNDSAWPSQSLMCHECGVNIKTLRKHLNELQQHGYITIDKYKMADTNQWTNNRYTPLK